MVLMNGRRAALLTLLAAPSQVLAQADPAPAPAPAETSEAPAEEIIVTAPPTRGDVIGRGVPDVTLGRDEVATYGAANVGELLEGLKPQTGEQPVILVNGRRISSPEEINRLPPEAIERVDILPEEVALAYGYRADQRVVNIVLERKFQAVTGMASARYATEGGRSESIAGVNYVRTSGNSRASLDLFYGRDTPLYESERDLVSAGDAGRYRTLLPDTEMLGVGATLNRPVFDDVSATLSARYITTDNESGLGLAVDDRFGEVGLLGENRTRKGQVGLTLNGRIAPWHWSLITNYDWGRNATRNDRSPDPLDPDDLAVSKSANASADLVVFGPIAHVPAGKVSTSLKASIASRDLDSRTVQNGVELLRDISNRHGTLSANVNLPIASRRNDMLSFLGDLSANLYVSRDHVSSVGEADNIGVGLSWSPAPALRLTATITNSEGLPPATQRGDPTVLTPNVPLYDFARGETVEVTRIDGGNPTLRADDRWICALSGRLKPFESSSLTLNLSYSSIRTDDLIGPLPAATPEIEAAFPERFTRDDQGRLLSIDARPVNFARAEKRQLSWGLFYAVPLGPSERSGEGVAGADEAVMASVMGEDMGGGSARNQGRLLLSLSHSWQIKDELLIRAGLPVLDRLDGATFGGRGQSRHMISARANFRKNGVGASIDTRWQSGSTIRGGVTDLAFSDQTTVNLRLFADLGRRGPLVGTRLSFDVGNLFDSRTRVRDAFGNTPLGYQSDYLDPLGRTVRVGFRAQF